MRRHAAAVGGVRLVEPRRIKATHERLQRVIKLLRRIALVARTPDCNGWMVSVANYLIGDVGKICRSIGWVGTVIWIGLKKFIPQQDSVLVRHVIEVGTGALPHPVADDVEVRQRVHVELSVQSFSRN